MARIQKIFSNVTSYIALSKIEEIEIHLFRTLFKSEIGLSYFIKPRKNIVQKFLNDKSILHDHVYSEIFFCERT